MKIKISATPRQVIIKAMVEKITHFWHHGGTIYFYISSPFMYFLYPCLYQETVVCVSGDALWRFSKQGGRPERLTQDLGALSHPCIDPSGQNVAFLSEQDVNIIALEGGACRKLTHRGLFTALVGWLDDEHILAISTAEDPFRQGHLYKVHGETGIYTRMTDYPCEHISFGANTSSPSRPAVIECYGYGYLSWKRYRGGTAGQLWIDRTGQGQFERLLRNLKSNLLYPHWIDQRIFFLSDHEGHGNIYSCTLQGDDIQRHTHHTDHYVRHLHSSEDRLIYSCGGDIYIWENGQTQHVPVSFSLGKLDKVRESENPQEYLTSFMPSPEGKKIALTTRGRLFQLTPHKGPSIQLGQRDDVRYRHSIWFKDQTLISVCEERENQIWELYKPESLEPQCIPVSSESLCCGHVTSLQAHPHEHKVIFTNHRHEIFMVDFSQENPKTFYLGVSARGPVLGYDWSPCGRWIVYGLQCHLRGSSIHLYDTKTENQYKIQDNFFQNSHPVFDLEGKYIFFLSARTFKPESDALGTTLTCQDAIKPYALILKKDQDSPFVLPLLHHTPLDEEDKEDQSDKEDYPDAKIPGFKSYALHYGTQVEDEQNGDTVHTAKQATCHNDGQAKVTDAESGDKDAKKIDPTIIDLEGLETRIVAFPLPARAYTSLASLKGHVMYTITDEKNDVLSYDLAMLKEEPLVQGIDGYALSLDRQWMMYLSGGRLRTVRAGAKVDDAPDASFQRGGWLDWGRIDLRVCLIKEWRQMFDEAWRLQKEMFWMPSLGEVDWDDVYARYRPLVERLGCHRELLMLIADMQGELGTSHAYVWRDHEASKREIAATLAARLTYVPEKGAYRLENQIKGDAWDALPLQRPGLDLKVGDLIWAIGGQKLSQDFGPDEALFGKTGDAVPLLVSQEDGSQKRTITVFPITRSNEKKARYRQWVEGCRSHVHQATQGKAGYIHLPDMQSFGYGEFLRSYLHESDKGGLIIDARFNGGGNISYLILDFLRRYRLGYDQTRHQGIQPYPSDSPRGPMVALINEYTGSDGDIFAHSFKNLQMGPLIGKRTWGGVVGIWPRYSLLDGTMTTQPEYSFWFHDVGWKVENHGVDPTIEVELTPQDYSNGIDSQLERGIHEIMLLIENDATRQAELSCPPALPRLKAPLFA